MKPMSDEHHLHISIDMSNYGMTDDNETPTNSKCKKLLVIKINRELISLNNIFMVWT